jgi:hypothetical protein
MCGASPIGSSRRAITRGQQLQQCNSMLGKQRLVHILAPFLPFCRPCPPFRPCPAAAECATSMSAACHTVPDGSNTMFHEPLHSCGETLYYAPQLRMARSLVDHPTTCCQVMGVPGQQVRMQCAMLICQTTQIEMCFATAVWSWWLTFFT